MEAIAENPCHQFFIGLPSFSVKCPFTYGTPALFRHRTTAEMPMAANESFLKDSPSTPEHRDAQPGWGKAAPAPEAGADGVARTLILDAACPPVDIRFPQDFSLLDEAREKTDGIVLVTLKPYKWHFVFLWFLLGALPPNPWSFSGIGTSGESLKEAVFSRHRPGFRPFVHPAIP